MEDCDSGVISLISGRTTSSSMCGADDRSTAGSRSSAASLSLSEVSSPAPQATTTTAAPSSQNQQQPLALTISTSSIPSSNHSEVRVWRDPQLVENNTPLVRHIHSVQHHPLMMTPSGGSQVAHHPTGPPTVAPPPLPIPFQSLPHMSLLLPPPLYAADLWSKQQQHLLQQQHHHQQQRYDEEKPRDHHRLEKDYRDMDRHKEMERHEQQQQRERERQEKLQISNAEQAVSKHFEESLRNVKDKHKTLAWPLNPIRSHPPTSNQALAAAAVVHLGLVQPPSSSGSTIVIPSSAMPPTGISPSLSISTISMPAGSGGGSNASSSSVPITSMSSSGSNSANNGLSNSNANNNSNSASLMNHSSSKSGGPNNNNGISGTGNSSNNPSDSSGGLVDSVRSHHHHHHHLQQQQQQMMAEEHQRRRIEQDRLYAAEQQQYRERELDREKEFERMRQQHQAESRNYYGPSGGHRSSGPPQQPPPSQQSSKGGGGSISVSASSMSSGMGLIDYGQHRGLTISPSTKHLEKQQQQQMKELASHPSTYSAFYAHPSNTYLASQIAYHKDLKTKSDIPAPPPLMSDIKQSSGGGGGVIVKNDTNSMKHQQPPPHQSSSSLQVIHASSNKSAQQQHYKSIMNSQPQPPPSMYEYRGGGSGGANLVSIQSSHHLQQQQQQQQQQLNNDRYKQSLLHQQQQQQSSYRQVPSPKHLPQGPSPSQQQQHSYGHIQSKPKVSSPAPSHIYGKPDSGGNTTNIIIGSNSGGPAGIVTGIPVCRAPPPHSQPSIQVITKSSPISSGGNSGNSFSGRIHEPPPAHSSRNYGRMYASNSSLHHGASPPTASAAPPHPISTRSPSGNSGIMPIISLAQQQQLSNSISISPSPSAVVNSSHQNPPDVQTQPLDLGVSDRSRDSLHSNNSSESKSPPVTVSMTMKRKSNTPIHHHHLQSINQNSPNSQNHGSTSIAYEVKKKRTEFQMQQQQQQQQQMHHSNQYPIHISQTSQQSNNTPQSLSISTNPSHMSPHHHHQLMQSQLHHHQMSLHHHQQQQQQLNHHQNLHQLQQQYQQQMQHHPIGINPPPQQMGGPQSLNPPVAVAPVEHPQKHFSAPIQVSGQTSVSALEQSPNSKTQKQPTLPGGNADVPHNVKSPSTNNNSEQNSSKSDNRATIININSNSQSPAPVVPPQNGNSNQVPTVSVNKLPIAEPQKSVSPAPKPNAPRHLKKAWLQRHTGEDVEDTTGITGGGSCVKLPITIAPSTNNGQDVQKSSNGISNGLTNKSSPVNSIHNVGTMAVNSIAKTPHPKNNSTTLNNSGNLTTNKTPQHPKKNAAIINNLNNRDNGHNSDSEAKEDSSSSSDQERTTKSPPKRKPPKVKRKKGSGGGRKPIEDLKRKKAIVASESDKNSDSDKESVSDKDSDSGTSTSHGRQSKTTNGNLRSSNPVPAEVKERRKRGRRPKAKEEPLKKKQQKDEQIAARDPFRKPMSQLKRTGESFLQDGACFEVAPKLAKCRECRWTPNQRSKVPLNIFCRFYAFRRLRYTKNGQLTTAGFSDPHKDPTEDDVRLWIPDTVNPPQDLDLDMSRFVLTQVADQFCDLLQQEKEALAEHMAEDKTIAWKRVVQGVREMCDVCETTLFNFHWACNKCGFVVCIDCYKSRKQGVIKIWPDSGKDYDDFSWLLCTNRTAHEQDKLMLTQIIAGDSLQVLGKQIHEVRSIWGIKQYCECPMSKEPAPKGLMNMCRELMQTMTKQEKPNGMIKQEIKEEESLTNGNAVIKQEDSLSWLADVALQSENGGGGQKNGEKKEKDNENNSDSDDPSHSTLRDLLIRPSNKPNGSSSRASSPVPNGQKPGQKRQNPDGIESDDKSKIGKIEILEKRPRFSAKEHFPIRIMSMEKSKILYPKTPHSWLCDGKLLRLHDPQHSTNLDIFQEQWKRGQPVLISDVTKRLNKELWLPESFSRDFGEDKNDLVNCMNGDILHNQPMRKFWDGFDYMSKRLKDDKGSPMLLKLKDWPPGDDFAEMLPQRFTDLMKALPLSDYTHRNGRLNLASRLPDCFVRPDLGPKMYNAYGSALHPTKGTTNLHLDISDAVNVMVYVGIPKDGQDEDSIKEAFRAIDEAGCDILTRRRVRDKGELPGALWHIYAPQDADKIRELLNKVSIENGDPPEPNHDPIHDQSWYLDKPLRERLYKEFGVEGYPIAQCLGDAVFIPAGAPHQVRNLHNCIKVAEDFVSPENISNCFKLTQEFRELSDSHMNHEDKLQIKNIIYHAVKDALASLTHSLSKKMAAEPKMSSTTTTTTAALVKKEIKEEAN